MNIVKQFEGHDVRIVQGENGDPLWVGKDVCEVLGYRDTVNAMKQHCRGVAKHHPIIDTIGRTQNVRVITEPDLYRLIVGSNLPAAERFEKWVFEEVLPSIRRHGVYATPQAVEDMLNDPDTMIRTLQAFKSEREQRAIAEARAEKAEPKALLWDKTSVHGGEQTPCQLGKELGIGIQTFNKMLHTIGFQYSRGGSWLPMQDHINAGRARLIRKTFAKPDGSEECYFSVYITPKGRKYLCTKLVKEGLIQREKK